MFNEHEEDRLVIKDQTFTDVAVVELADVKAKYLVYKYYGCKKQMEKYAAYKRFLVCYAQMNDYDRLRVDNKAAEIFAKYMQTPECCMPYKILRRRYFMLWLLFTIILSIFMYLAIEPPYIKFMPEDKVPVPYTQEIDKMVHETVLALKDYVYDTTGDGQINCLDNAILFKVLWDRRYPYAASICEIVCNRDYDSVSDKEYRFNHLFNYVAGKPIEPQSWWTTDHSMQATWGSRYKPWLDVTWTSYWLERRRW